MITHIREPTHLSMSSTEAVSKDPLGLSPCLEPTQRKKLRRHCCGWVLTRITDELQDDNPKVADHLGPRIIGSAGVPHRV